ncbi:hypothetical protein GCM10022419_011760 [Nonomuraea rosea]|uniref:PPE domain-containing protein n=1 Tax=Nonomuraea rosea TaxID=638574 RepID=A0ABP6VI40_9ACTN
MLEPQPIKNGCLQGGNPSAYGGREAIRGLVMGTVPEEFGQVAGTYQATSEALGSTITGLRESAGRLVADGNWGGESARAMLTRLDRIQAYLQTLRDGVDKVPPSLATVSRELGLAKTQFDEATAQRTRTVYAMGSGGEVPLNNPDEDARQFMVRLNGVFHQAHGELPDRLPWDAELASAPPYQPPGRTSASSGDSQFEDTVPARSTTALADTSGSQPTTAGLSPAAPITSPVTGPVTSPVTSPATGPGTVPGTLAPIAAAPAGSLASVPGTGQPSTDGSVPGTNSTARPGTTGTPPQTPVATVPTTVPTGTPPKPAGNPLTHSAQDPYSGRALVAETGPSVRPGSVPVVDGSWPAAGPAAAAGERGAQASGGVPFMPMAGGAPQDGQSARRSVTSKGGDDDFFRPVIDCGAPVVG